MAPGRVRGGAAAPALATLLAVRRLDEGRFEGACMPGARSRMYGGQVVAQALHAAALQAGDDRAPHALHAFFLRPGDADEMVRYACTTLKTGRALSTVRVDALQGERLIMTALVSFHVGEQSVDLQAAAMPAVPGPGDLASSQWYPEGTNQLVRAPFDIRYTDPAPTSGVPAPPEQRVWLCSREPLPGPAYLQACALAYASDFTLTRTAHMPLQAYPAARLGSSLDHSMWFHRPARADDWLLFDQHSPSFADSRALSVGQLFDATGRLVASVAQEALIRMDAGGPKPPVTPATSAGAPR